MMPNINIFQEDTVDKHDLDFVPNTPATDACRKAKLAKVEKGEPEQDRAGNIGL